MSDAIRDRIIEIARQSHQDHYGDILPESWEDTADLILQEFNVTHKPPRIWGDLDEVPDLVDVYDWEGWIHYRRLTCAHAGRYYRDSSRCTYNMANFRQGPFVEVRWGLDEPFSTRDRIREEWAPAVLEQVAEGATEVDWARVAASYGEK